MARFASDIETDGFLDVLTRVHCIVNIDIDSGESYRYAPTASPIRTVYPVTVSSSYAQRTK